jgi:hypothetical protein
MTRIHTVWIPSAGSSTHQKNITHTNAQTGIRQDPVLLNFMDPETDFVGNDEATYMWLSVEQ